MKSNAVLVLLDCKVCMEFTTEDICVGVSGAVLIVIKVFWGSSSGIMHVPTVYVVCIKY